MSERLLKLGVAPEYFAHAKHFEHVFKSLGMPPAQIDAAIAWGATFDGKPEDLLPQFDQLCEAQGIDRVNADLAISWHQQVSERGIDNLPQPPAPAPSGDDHKRLQEIEEEMRKPKADSKYWKDPAMRDTYRELLERLESGGERAPAPTGNDSNRKAEIEALMKSDRAAYHRTGADKEYLQILQREAGETPDAESVPTPTTQGNENEQNTN